MIFLSYEMNEQFKNQVIYRIGNHMNQYKLWKVLVWCKILKVIIINFAYKQKRNR